MRIFQTELLIVMDLQDIPLNMYFRVMILIKYFGNSLLFNKSVKIQDGCQSNAIIPAAEFFSMLHYQLFGVGIHNLANLQSELILS